MNPTIFQDVVRIFSIYASHLVHRAAPPQTLNNKSKVKPKQKHKSRFYIANKQFCFERGLFCSSSLTLWCVRTGMAQPVKSCTACPVAIVVWRI